jgi:hypothetical protein
MGDIPHLDICSSLLLFGFSFSLLSSNPNLLASRYLFTSSCNLIHFTKISEGLQVEIT